MPYRRISRLSAPCGERCIAVSDAGRLRESYEKATGHRICRECGDPADDDEDPTVYDDVGLCESYFAEVEAEFTDLDVPYDPFDEQ